MGLLALGTAYEWDQAKKYAEHVRKHGIEQFLNVWDKVKGRVGDDLLWGDEIEYMTVSFDEKDKNARLSLRQSEILQELQLEEIEMSREHPGLRSISTFANPSSPSYSTNIPKFHAEYGRYMLESTPGAPYGASIKDLLKVEPNMELRRKIAKSKMKPHEVPITITSFPRLGAPGVFLDPHYEPTGPTSRSFFLPDEIINPHVRFPTLTANIRTRRGSKVAVNMPVYFDEKTKKPFRDETIPWNRQLYPEDRDAERGAALDNHIYMDSMGFGMGCCCLQITFQACNINEARRIYDALIPVGPIMLALTAAAPTFRGYLADVDCRWDVIAGSVDDRTEEERGLKPLVNDRYRIPKSRYDSVDCYLSQDATNRPEYNDTYMPINEGAKKRLMERGIDELLANHIAHLFIRDPIVVFSETVEQDDQTQSDHFENIQSTNWQTLRFKPPPPNSNIGWRVEFRSMEVQITDFENAAFSIFIALLVRAILSFGVNFYMPISKVDENMGRAHKRDACRKEKFFFRKNVFARQSGYVMHYLHKNNVFSSTSTSSSSSSHPSPLSPSSSSPPSTTRRPATGINLNGVNGVNGFSNGSMDPPLEEGHVLPNGQRFKSPCPSSPTSPTSGGHATPPLGPVENEYEEMTINEILNGKRNSNNSKNAFPGLVGLVEAYLNSIPVDGETRARLDCYIDLVRRRANGELQTTATWIRNFIRSHPDYRKDSVISKEINYDLLKAFDRIERGEQLAPELFGNLYPSKSAPN